MLDIKLLALTIFSLFLGRPELTVIAVIAKAEIKEKIAKETTTSTRVKPFPKKDFLYFLKECLELGIKVEDHMVFHYE